MTDDILPSWRPGAARTAVLDFVASVTQGQDAVPRPERVAVFDNDGTLWTEKPMPTQLHYIVEQWAAAALADPSLADTQPYQAAVGGDLAWLGAAVDKHYAGDDADLHTMVAAIVAGTLDVDVDDYEAKVAAFYRDARHLTLRKPYSSIVFQPMVELLRYLDDNDFACYIVSGGDRDFMRQMTQDYYGIPPERVVGSALGLRYDAESDTVRYGSSFSFLDDGPEKPVRIWSRIGRRPILAGGNSNGDLEMLRYVQGHPRSLSLLVRHDDAEREGAAYDAGAEHALEAGRVHGFTVVSVKDDWAQVYPSDEPIAEMAEDRT